MPHPFYAAYKRYVASNHLYISYAGGDPEESARLYAEHQEAVNALMATSLCRSNLRWALLIKLEILEHEMVTAAEDGGLVYPVYLPWLGYIKADMISLKADHGLPRTLEAA